MVLELYLIVTAVVLWGNRWTNTNICFLTDNEALVSVINKQSTREKHAMTLIQNLVLNCLKYNIYFTAKHVPGLENKLADKLSRLQLAESKQLAAWAAESPRTLPWETSPSGFVAL